jgi:hypothetical protein
MSAIRDLRWWRDAAALFGERVEALEETLAGRIRYFTHGAVIGSRSFVNEAFASARERGGAKRKDGAWEAAFLLRHRVFVDGILSPVA